MRFNFLRYKSGRQRICAIDCLVIGATFVALALLLLSLWGVVTGFWLDPLLTIACLMLVALPWAHHVVLRAVYADRFAQVSSFWHGLAGVVIGVGAVLLLLVAYAPGLLGFSSVGAALAGTAAAVVIITTMVVHSGWITAQTLSSSEGVRVGGLPVAPPSFPLLPSLIFARELVRQQALGMAEDGPRMEVGLASSARGCSHSINSITAGARGSWSWGGR